MGKHEREKKQVNRLQLRREAIRVLASDSLARVAGGIGGNWEDYDISVGCGATGKPSGP